MITQFVLSEEEAKVAARWLALHKHKTKYGTRSIFKYIFVPNGIGTAVYIKCKCGSKEDITDYASW